MTLNQLPPTRSLPTVWARAARSQLESVVNGTIRNWGRMSRGATAGLGIGLVIAGGAAAAATIPTSGPVPTTQSGSIDWQNVPDFISVAANGNVVGYAPRLDVLPFPEANGLTTGLGATVPVYKGDLQTLVGHVYPGIGYVPLGSSPSSVPCQPETTVGNSGSQSIACPSTSISLPNVVGTSTPAAAAELSGLSVLVHVINVSSQSVANGIVVTMSPAAGTAVSARSTVTIENSIGPNG
jgi:PASTA domain